MIYYSRNETELSEILNDVTNEPHFTAYASDGSAAVFCPQRQSSQPQEKQIIQFNSVQLGFPRLAVISQADRKYDNPAICLSQDSTRPLFISSEEVDQSSQNKDIIVLVEVDEMAELAIAEAAVLSKLGFNTIVVSRSLDTLHYLSKHCIFPIAFTSQDSACYQSAVLAGADILILNESFFEIEQAAIDAGLAELEDVCVLSGREFEYQYRETIRYVKPGVFKTVAFQGTHGAYSEMAAKSLLGPCETIPYPGFRDAFAAVLSGEVEAAMIPVENSLGGSVHENYDILTQTPDVKIIGEVPFRIQHSLIGVKGATLDQIKEAYSHPQGLAQCKLFLEKHNIKPIPFYDTAGSAEFIAKEGDVSKAGIAHAGAADVYDAQVIQEGIESNHKNFTRFFVIVRDNHPDPENPQKASIVFSTRDEAGALLKCMQVLAHEGLNLSKLESRPIPGRPWSYMFYMDLDLPQKNESFEKGINKLKEICEDFKLLGIYPVYK